MPNIGGYDYWDGYYNNEGTVNKKRKRGQLGKPTPTETLTFLEDSTKDFEKKHGRKVKTILVSQEMKDFVDGRTKGKTFLKKIKLLVEEKQALGLRTIYLSELNKEEF